MFTDWTLFAFRRLKIALNLPPIQPRPPIAPRVYNRLHTHLNVVLPGPNSTPGRGRSTRAKTNGDLGSDPRPLPSRATPSKEQTLSLFRKPSSTAGTPTKSTGAGISGVAVGIGLPPWVKPVIKFICAETHQPQLGSTIVAGMDAIVAPFGQRTDDDWINQNITAILAAVYFYVTIRIVALTKDQPMTKEPFALQRREILKLLEQARAGVQVTTAGRDADAWSDWQEVKARDFSSAVSQMEEQGWLLADWFKGLDDIVQPHDWDKVAAPEDVEDADPEVPTQTRRSDTMYQDKYDYLSEARRADYVVWKEDALQRISVLRNTASTSTPMEIDAR